MLFASIISLFMGYFACVLLFFGRESKMFKGPSEEVLEEISDEEFVDYIDEYLHIGSEGIKNLQKRKVRIKVSESIFAAFILIYKYFF